MPPSFQALDLSHFPVLCFALANPLPLALPVPLIDPPLPAAPPRAILEAGLWAGAGVVNLDDLVEVGGFSTKEVSVVLIGLVSKF